MQLMRICLGHILNNTGVFIPALYQRTFLGLLTIMIYTTLMWYLGWSTNAIMQKPVCFVTESLILICKDGADSLIVAGSGKPLRQFIYSRDLAKLMIWALREYNEVSPIMLSVSENDEVTIRQVAESIVKAFSFSGNIVVIKHHSRYNNMSLVWHYTAWWSI